MGVFSGRVDSGWMAHDKTRGGSLNLGPILIGLRSHLMCAAVQLGVALRHRYEIRYSSMSRVRWHVRWYRYLQGPGVLPHQLVLLNYISHSNN